MSQAQIATVLSVATFPTVVAGKFVDTFAVVDQDGNLVGNKSHRKEEEAAAELGSLKYFAQGMDFARATAKDGAKDQALVAKANTIAAYLLYLEVGVPSSETETDAAVDAAVAEVTEATEEEEF